jgi:hypothetical protein
MSIRTALLEIGQAERQYVNAHGAYGTLDQLRGWPPELGTDRRGYVFVVEPMAPRASRPSAAVWTRASRTGDLDDRRTMQVTSR